MNSLLHVMYKFCLLEKAASIFTGKVDNMPIRVVERSFSWDTSHVEQNTHVDDELLQNVDGGNIYTWEHAPHAYRPLEEGSSASFTSAYKLIRGRRHDS